MATKAIPVIGGTVGWSTTATGYVSIAEAKTLLIPEDSKEYIDVTSLDSPNGRREFIPGLIDAGELTLECNYTPDTMDLAKTYSDNGTLIYFETQLVATSDQTSTGDKFEWSGFVTPSIQQANVDGAVMLNILVRTSGGMTYTQGS